MESLIKADIFFFISTIVLVILGVLATWLFYYLIKAGRNLYQISEDLKEVVKDSESFVFDLKERLENNLIFRFFFPRSRKRPRNVTKETKTIS